MMNAEDQQKRVESIVVATQKEAQDVVDALKHLVLANGAATIQDLYDLVGLTGSFGDHKWGWGNLNEARIKRTESEQFVFDLPIPKPLQYR